jgi:lipopolysaccharide transport system ATP-binding protein
VSDPVLALNGLGKCFRSYRSDLDRLLHLLGLPRPHRDHWVLRDINLQLGRGESLALVGVNGAGKSTLLKIITGTLQASEGSCRLQGRVAAMLELGMGFHDDSSGRDNVLLAGQLLGYSLADLEALLPSIARFAELGAYFDQPLRVYSSGMRLRLGFALATARRPDLLIIDEALSVGDAYFQHKCFDRIRSMAAEGTSLLIVSHDPAAILGLCQRAVLLQAGGIACSGGPETVLNQYNALIAARETAPSSAGPGADDGAGAVSGQRSGSGEVRIRRVQLSDAAGRPLQQLACGETIRLDVWLRTRAALPRLTLGFLLKDRIGQWVYGSNTALLGQPVPPLPAGATLRFRITLPGQLGEGSYSLSLSLHDGIDHLQANYDWWDRALMFEVAAAGGSRGCGLIRLPTRIEGPIDLQTGLPSSDP